MPGRPRPDEFDPSYGGYVSLVPDSGFDEVLRGQPAELARCAEAVPGEREQFRYDEGKWSIREVFGHVIDAERVFGFRAFSFGRGETAPLPSFDENDYVARSRYHERPLETLVEEFRALREAHLLMLTWQAESDWVRKGTASGNSISVRALAYIMAGHVRHHIGILRDRYGVIPRR
jgi:hypothetical protein